MAPRCCSRPRFTGQIRDPARWAGWVRELGGGTLRLVWVRSDAATLRRRIEDRGSGRDSGKLDGFDAFLARMLPGVTPPVPHVEIDNRLAATASVADQPPRPPRPRADRGARLRSDLRATMISEYPTTSGLVGAPGSTSGSRAHVAVAHAPRAN